MPTFALNMSHCHNLLKLHYVTLNGKFVFYAFSNRLFNVVDAGFSKYVTKLIKSSYRTELLWASISAPKL